jgi:hypothetical protein
MRQTGFFERQPGNKSMMRLLAFLGFILGGVVSLWGLYLLTVVVDAVIDGKAGAVDAMGSLLMVISGGLALAGGGQALKVVQQRGEIRESTTEDRSERTVEESTVTTESSGGGNQYNDFGDGL